MGDKKKRNRILFTQGIYIYSYKRQLFPLRQDSRGSPGRELLVGSVSNSSHGHKLLQCWQENVTVYSLLEQDSILIADILPGQRDTAQ